MTDTHQKLAERPIMPHDYGVPQTVEGTLPWSFVDERMRAAANYWIATVRPDGRPHVMPVWGAWLDGNLYIEGSPETIRHRNLAGNPNVVAHLEDGKEAVIVEGTAEAVAKPPRELGQRLSVQMKEKYAPAGYAPGPEQWDNGGLYVIRPRKVFAWTQFPQNTTRWRFDV
jgi:nitroimidazol reductase NimA-like FMN-containing flavoprotein (pyridoxamine 5'-phosphate oxidase superfamily)